MMMTWLREKRPGRTLGWLMAVAVSVWLSATAVLAQVAPVVRKVTIDYVGPATVSEPMIRSHIRVKPGDSYLQANTSEDIRSLYGTGQFRQVVVEPVALPDGIELVYHIIGKPRLTAIKFEGNKKYSESKLSKKVTSKVGEPLDEAKIFNDTLELQKFYQKNGYHQTTVTNLVSIDERAGRGTVTFQINESPKIKIERVEFVGAQNLKESKLRKVTKTRKRWFMSWLTGSGRLKDDVLEDDRERLADHYRNQGYIDFELQDVKVDSTGPKSVVVRFVFTEGRQYKVGDVAFKGNTLFSNEELLRSLKMGVGETFTPKGLDQDLERLRDRYGAKGYIDATVVPLKNPNVERGTMDLTYQVEEGQQVFIEKIEIKGNTKTKDKVIRRELAVAPGEVFDMTRVKLSQKRLEGLQYFEKVDARAEQPGPTDPPNRRNLVVSVDEKNTGHFTIGAGFSSIDSLIGYVEVRQSNFDLFKPPRFEGGGQKMRLRATLGTVRQDYLISFIEPWFLERKLALGVDLYHRVLNYVSLNDLYDERRTGARLSLSRALGTDLLIGSVAYTIERVGVVNVNPNASQVIKDEAGYRLVSKVGASLTYDTRDHALMPTRGHRVELFSELAGGPFMGDTDYYKVELRGVKYFRGFHPSHIVEVAARAGSMAPFGDSTRVPLFDRFFLGGLYSLRGFDYREVGPKDVNGEPIGGNTYWFGSVEYSIPIIQQVRFAVFYDIGNVYAQSWSFNHNSALGEKFYNDNWGVGIRLNLPIGPMRFDFGVPITTDSRNDSSGKFQFGVGYTREF